MGFLLETDGMNLVQRIVTRYRVVEAALTPLGMLPPTQEIHAALKRIRGIEHLFFDVHYSLKLNYKSKAVGRTITFSFSWYERPAGKIDWLTHFSIDGYGFKTDSVSGGFKSLKDPHKNLAKLMREAAKSFREAEKKILAYEDKQREKEEAESGGIWSVATTGRGHSYASEIWEFPSKSKATDFAKETGNAYVIRGTQMWNEPIGQIEESDKRSTFVKFFS